MADGGFTVPVVLLQCGCHGWVFDNKLTVCVNEFISRLYRLSSFVIMGETTVDDGFDGL